MNERDLKTHLRCADAVLTVHAEVTRLRTQHAALVAAARAVVALSPQPGMVITGRALFDAVELMRAALAIVE